MITVHTCFGITNIRYVTTNYNLRFTDFPENSIAFRNKIRLKSNDLDPPPNKEEGECFTEQKILSFYGKE